MGDPNLFRAATLTIENPQSKEEDEELEEQRRRQEELEDLLSDGIHAFKYDQSTINSSTSTSLDGGESNMMPSTNPLNFNYDDETTRNSTTNRSHDILQNLEQNYKDADANEQLRILYEVRMREIQGLRDEYKNYQGEKAHEIGLLKNKITLAEAEVRHLQLSTTNLASLLEEKTEIIKKLNHAVDDKDAENFELRRQIEEMKIEICSYSTSINELQLKLANDHPFSASARNLNFEQLQKTHHDQVARLENRLEEEIRKCEILEREKNTLQDDLRNVLKSKIETDGETDLMIVELSKKLKSSQQQCKDLFNLGEAIKKESDHFKERLKQESQGNELSLSRSKNSSLDHDTLLIHLEKLKRMVLDKNIEMNTLHCKLKLYETDMEELFEYRNVLNNLENHSNIQSCNIKEHRDQLLLLRQQLERSREMMEERNREIANLHMLNNESRQKIEEMLLQTRADIQNLSDRYSLPQLEKMAENLRVAEQTITELRAQLEEKSGRELSVELEKAHQQISNLQQKSYDEKLNFEEMLRMIKNDLMRSEDEIRSLKSSVDELRQSESALREENNRLKCGKSNDLEENELKSLKDQLRQVRAKLESARSGSHAENVKIVAKLKKKIHKLHQKLLQQPVIEKSDLDNLTEWSAVLNDLIGHFHVVNCDNDLDKIQELSNSSIMLQGEKVLLEDKVRELEIDLKEIPILRKSLEACEEDIKKLNVEKADLAQKFEQALRDLQNAKETKGDFRQAELLKVELDLRETLQEENAKKLTDIEEGYKKVLNDKMGTYKKEIENLKNQENLYRQQLSIVLAECSEKMIALEEGNAKLRQNLRDLQQEYTDHKVKSKALLKKYEDVIVQNRREFEGMKNNWERLIEERLAGYVGVEKQCHRILKGLASKRSTNQAKMEQVEQAYNHEINKLKQRLDGL